MSFLRNSSNLLALARVSVTNAVIGTNTQTRCIKRWVGPTLRELRRRTKIVERKQPSQLQPQPRSGHIEWNYRAELFAFSKRLHEEFQLPLLQAAFTQRAYVAKEQQRQRDLGIEDADIEMADNNKLAEHGEHVAKQYVQAFLQHSLPQLPAAGQRAFAEFLLSSEQLAHIASHLGMKELLLVAEYPPSEAEMSQSLLAVIGALAESSGIERAFTFVRDFICTALNQRDPLDIWSIEKPEELLRQVCKERKLAEPEPRLLGDCGKNTVLAAYHVGIYVDKQMLGKGYGEDVNIAISTASLNALQKLFGIHDDMRPFDFQLQVESKGVNKVAAK